MSESTFSPRQLETSAVLAVAETSDKLEMLEVSETNLTAFSGETATSFIMGALEAILMVASEPVTLPELAEAIGVSEIEISQALAKLQEQYETKSVYPRGAQIKEVAGGWRIYSHPRFADVVTKFVTAGQSNRLSIPALETLAVVAYRQPVTRAQVAAIRGVEVDSVMRTLQTRGLIQQVGTNPATGAGLYETTDYFLMKMGMKSLADLAPLAPYLPEDTDLSEVEKEIKQ